MNLLLAMIVAAQVGAGKRVALVVGVSEFADRNWPTLVYTEKDARDVADALTADFDEIRRIEGVATRDRVLAALAGLGGSATSDFDTVVVYFSTHGTLAYDAKGELVRVLVLQDTTKGDPIMTGLPYEELTRRLDAVRARQKLVILAACHSGAGKSKLDDQLTSELSSLKAPFFAEPHLTVGEGQVILAASAFGETAREDASLKNDIYTHFLLEALDVGFDLDEDGAITALEAHHYARRQTIAFTKGRQRPTLTAEIIGVDPIILRGRRVRRGRPMIAGFSSAFAGATLEVDGRAKGILPGAFIVEDGTRRVRVLRPGSNTAIFDRQLNATTSSVIILDEHVEGPASKWLVHAGGAYMFVRGDVGRTHLPGHYMVGAGARYPLQPWVRIGLSASGTATSQTVELGQADAPVPAEQAIVLGRVTGDLSVSLYTRPWLDVTASVDVGWTAGRRRLEVKTVAHNVQLFSYPFGGVAAEGTVWILPAWGLRAEAGAELLLVVADGDLRPAFADRYGLFVTARF